MKIRIINGSYGLHDGRRVVTMTARSGAFEVEDAEGAALIAAGVAAGSSEFGIRSSELPCGGRAGALLGAAAAAADIVTPAAGGDKSGEPCESGVRSAESGDPGESAEFADYLTMSVAELRELCDGRGIAYRKNAGVKALAALLEADDDAALPELFAAEPVEA